MCWYCHWGWSRPVADIYRKYVAIVGESAMQYGPAHIVWADENFEDYNIQWCLDAARRGKYWHEGESEETSEQKAAVIASLEELLEIPECVRCPEPEDYDDEHPEDYPPPVGIEMVRGVIYEPVGSGT